MFNAQPTGTVISRRNTLHSSLIEEEEEKEEEKNKNKNKNKKKKN